MSDLQPASPSPVRDLSIFKTTWRVFKASCWKVLPLLLLFAVLSGSIASAVPSFHPQFPTREMCAESEAPQKCRQEHKEEINKEFASMLTEAKEKIPSIVVFWILMGVVSLCFSYLVTRQYLHAVAENVAPYSVERGGRYLLIMIWRNIRPILWNLIPVIGQVMYIRSLLRYETAGIQVLLGRKEELKLSWDLTDGNVWRIFGVKCAYSLIMTLLAIPVLLIGGLVAGAVIAVASAGGGVNEEMLMAAVEKVGSVLGNTVSQTAWLWVESAFTVAVYQVLTQEKAMAPATEIKASEG